MTLEEFQKKLQELGSAVEQALSGNALQPTADKLANNIRERLREGKGVAENGGEPQDFKELADMTVRRRRFLQAEGKLSPQTSPERSNLTETGEMGDSIQGTATDKGITLDLQSEENKEKAQKNAELGRPFMHLSGDDIKDTLMPEVNNLAVDAIHKKLSE